MFIFSSKTKQKLLYSINVLFCKASRHVKYNPYNTLESKGTKKYGKNYTSSGGNVGGKKRKLLENKTWPGKKKILEKVTFYSDGFCTKWSSAIKVEWSLVSPPGYHKSNSSDTGSLEHWGREEKYLNQIKPAIYVHDQLKPKSAMRVKICLCYSWKQTCRYSLCRQKDWARTFILCCNHIPLANSNAGLLVLFNTKYLSHKRSTLTFPTFL